MKPTQTQFATYQQVFDYFNCRLFKNSLPDCMLSFSRRRRSAHTLFTAGQWQKEATAATPELSLNLQQMGTGEPIEVMATLVREMVHLWQETHGQPSSKWYFNRQWAEKMASIGLIPTATGAPGGRKTGQGIKHYIDPEGRFAKAFKEMPATHLWPFRPVAFASNKSAGYSEKVTYRCIGCGAKVWGKGGMGLVCECGNVFVDEP